MPSGDYTAVGGGALKLKGAKVQKKKKKRDKADLEKNISTGQGSVTKTDSPPTTAKPTDDAEEQNSHSDNDTPVAMKTESERKYDEIRKKRVRAHPRPPLTMKM